MARLGRFIALDKESGFLKRRRLAPAARFCARIETTESSPDDLPLSGRSAS